MRPYLMDFLVFDATSMGSVKTREDLLMERTKVGYSAQAVGGLNNGPRSCIFGNEISGVFVDGTLDSLYIELGESVVNKDAYAGNSYFAVVPEYDQILSTNSVGSTIAQTVKEHQNAIMFQEIIIWELDSGASQGSGPAYDINEIVGSTEFISGFGAVATPVYTHELRDKDVVDFYGFSTDSNFAALKLSAKGFSPVQGVRYCVQFVAKDVAQRNLFGFAPKIEMESQPSFMPALIKSSAKTAVAYTDAENEISTTLEYKGEPINPNHFDYFELHNYAGSAIDSRVHDFIFYGEKDGELVLRLAGLTDIPGLRKTTLVGYNAERSDGVVLWHDNMSSSKLSIEVRDY